MWLEVKASSGNDVKRKQQPWAHIACRNFGADSLVPPWARDFGFLSLTVSHEIGTESSSVSCPSLWWGQLAGRPCHCLCAALAYTADGQAVEHVSRGERQPTSGTVQPLATPCLPRLLFDRDARGASSSGVSLLAAVHKSLGKNKSLCSCLLVQLHCAFELLTQM